MSSSMQHPVRQQRRKSTQHHFEAREEPQESSPKSGHALLSYSINDNRNDGPKTRPPPSAVGSALFTDERRDAISLPRIEGDAASIISSHPSSPYSSPQLLPRARTGAAAGPMEEVTLPPIQAAVPMRRGAVSGASSGPSLPFPPIRPTFEEEDGFPSRGPSPTLGKRGSFSMGHSNHVPPGPDVQLPTPVLSGSGERRMLPSLMSGHSLYHSNEGGPPRLPEESSHHYHPVPQRAGIPWAQNKAAIPRSEVLDANAPPFHPFAHHSPSMPSSSLSSHRGGHFSDEPSRGYPPHARLLPPHSTHPSAYPTQPRSVSGPYRYDYHRDDGPMSPASNHSSSMHMDTSVSPRMRQANLIHDDHHLHDMDGGSVNGKRPRSAPRVMSSQPRIFACTQCPARFARNHDLKRHQRGHLSVRPYPCNWCGKSFSRKDALKRHILVKGCGKDGKGGGGGKGEGREKRSSSNSGEKRADRFESSAGDQGDHHSGEEDEHDEQGSEEYRDGEDRRAMTMQQQRHWQRRPVGDDQYRPSSYKGEYEADNQENTFSGHSISFGRPESIAGLTMHAVRPFASVA